MPSRVVLRLKLEKPIRGREIKPDTLHGLFFKLLGGELAEELHTRYGNVKPYSLSCGEMFGEKPTEVLHLEINLLEEKLLAKLLSGIILGDKEDLFLGGVGITDFSILPVREKYIATYQSLKEDTFETQRWLVRFLSPTTFRRNDIDLPFPLPELVFKGLVKRWNTFSPTPVGVDLRPFYNLVKVSSFSLKSQRVEFSNGGKLTAFRGFAVFNLSLVRDGEARRWFSILLKFSNWSGIGRKTTMGLGKVLAKPLEG